jgi:two-component system chemotaxis response regulator CheV
MEKDTLYNGSPDEIEILEFKAGGNSYGIYVSDIKEILTYDKKPTPIPNSHPFIEGIIMPRDFLIPIINFVKCLDLFDVDDFKNEMLVVTEINDLNVAIHVDSVCGIYTKNVADITKPGKKVSTSQKGVITGIVNMDDHKIEMVDLRKIINNINPELKVVKDEL